MTDERADIVYRRRRANGLLLACELALTGVRPAFAGPDRVGLAGCGSCRAAHARGRVVHHSRRRRAHGETAGRQRRSVRRGDDHPLSGWPVPELTLDDGRRVAELLHDARPVLLDLAGGVADAARC